MIINYRLSYITLVLFLISNLQLFSQSNFNFNNESTEGWTLNGPIDTAGNPIASYYSGIYWADESSYPNTVGYDSLGDTNGSIAFNTGDGGIQSASKFWIVQFLSPDLSSDINWQYAKGYSIEVAENMSYSSPIWVNLFVQVFDNDLNKVRYFYSGTAQTISKGVWNQLTFNWSTISSFPTNYIIQGIHVNIWGSTADYYAGSAYLDEVNLIPGRSITVTSPNGGENWNIYNNYNIKWTSRGVSTVNLSYSTDNGQTWNSIASNIDASLGTYSWNIPNTPSNNCRVMVSENTEVGLYDVSDNAFTISLAPSITVSSPNGGESWAAGNKYNITWVSSGIDSVKIDYSTDGGKNWLAIVSGIPDFTGSYLWTVPNTPSSTCLIRISDLSNPQVNDKSDTVFTITSNQSITVTSPNGGENWTGGNKKNISWTSTSIDSVNIQYSTDQGKTWINVVSNLSASAGSYIWTVPNTPSALCLVRIYNSSNPNIYDQSDSLFTISPKPFITISSPNGGENWPGGSIQSISWTNSLSIITVSLEYSTNGGINWTIINSNVKANSGIYSWLVPNTPSSVCFVRITDVADTTISDTSNAPFKISPTASVTVTSPNGGENWMAGSIHNITWLSYLVTNVKIEYSTDNGSSWLAVISSISASSGSYSWNIPNVESSQCLVRISDISNSSIKDQSDSAFSIIPEPSIAVIAPNGGEKLNSGSIFRILWLSTSIDKLKIEYSSDNGSNWNLISANTPAASGFYDWTIPNTPSVQCLIKLSDVSDTTVNDVSNAVFTINSVPFITVTSPNGAEKWTIGSTYKITWLSNSSSQLKIEYSFDNGISWNLITSNTPANTGVYYWLIPNTPSAQCLVKMTDTANPSITDESDAVFTISPQQTINVVSPHGGENWAAGTTQSISWINSDSVANVKIEYSTDNGKNWNLIISGTPAGAGTYTWIVPNTISSQCLVRISDAANSSIYGQSSSVFTISAAVPVITVVSPKKGDTWMAGNIYTIQWQQNLQETVNIELFKANNQVLVIAAPVYAVNQAYGTYQWTVPLDLISGQDYRIKVASSVNDALYTFSDYFSIETPAPLANFGTSPVRGLKPLTVSFSDSSSGNINSWLWNFGDGTTGSSQNPDHIYYQSGVYTVELTVTGPGGSNSVTKQNLISVDSLNWNTPQTVNLGDSATVITNLPEYFKPTLEKLFYRMGGQIQYTETDFRIQGNSVIATIPSVFITVRGIEYYTMLSDGKNTITYPESNPQNNPAVINVILSNIIPTLSFQSKKYEMISVPLNLGNQNVIDYLKNAYGDYDQSNWRVFRWDNNTSSYLEYPNLNADLKPGIAFWLITNSGESFNLTNVQSVNTSQPYEIKLQKGWNQIGNPFAFPVAFDSIINSNLIQSGPISWNSSLDDYDNINQSILEPWKGYWILDTTGSISIFVKPVEDQGPRKISAASNLGKGEFIVQIKASNKSGGRDYQNYVGMLNKPVIGFNRLNILEPPPISGKLELTIIRDGKKYAQNIVPVSEDGAYWDIMIKSNSSDKNISLQFDKISSLPEGFKIWFLDKTRLLSLPVTGNNIGLQLPDNGVGQYRLIIGKEDYAKQYSDQIPLVPLNYSLFQNYPNPFNPSTNIMYNLREKGQVTIEVYDILGERVNILTNNEIQLPGTHVISWNGKNSNGNNVASGVYIYRIIVASPDRKAIVFSDSKMMVLLK